MVELSFTETRVLGVLIEKERTVPDSYPLTLNALVAGCNQKTSREPIVALPESEVQAALDALKAKSLVIESSGGRAARFSHNFERVFQVPRQASALLAVLMLRGPQTAGELRINCERLHAFADISSVEAFLRELAERAAGALVAELPRQPGTRETRWVQLLAGPPAVEHAASTAGTERVTPNPGELPALKTRVEHLERELEELKVLVAKLCAERALRE